MTTEQIVAIVIAIFGCTGFWTFVNSLVARKQNKSKEIECLCKGVLAVLHRDLYEDCDTIISQRYITQEQYENLQYMAEPYIKLGGNGTVEKMLKIIDTFEMR